MYIAHCFLVGGLWLDWLVCMQLLDVERITSGFRTVLSMASFHHLWSLLLWWLPLPRLGAETGTMAVNDEMLTLGPRSSLSLRIVSGHRVDRTARACLLKPLV